MSEISDPTLEAKREAIIAAAIEWDTAGEMWRIGSGHDWRVTDSAEDRARYSVAHDTLKKAVAALK